MSVVHATPKFRFTGASSSDRFSRIFGAAGNICGRPMAIRIVQVLLSAQLAVVASYGASIPCVWQGPAVGNWSVAANWSCNAIPNNSGGLTYSVTWAQGSGGLNIDATVDSITVTGGILVGAQAATLTVQNSLLITGGSFSPNANIYGPVNFGPFAAAGGTIGGNLQLFGTASLPGTALNYLDNLQLVNNGQFTINGTASLIPADGQVPASASFANGLGGTLTKQDNDTATLNIAVTNTGDLNVEAGILNLGTYTQFGGSTEIAEGATLQSSQSITIRGGDIGGDGIISTPTLVIYGDLAPALQIGGDLTIRGNLKFVSTSSPESVSTFDTPVGGPGAWPDYSTPVEVLGSTELGGDLRVLVWPGYTPPSDFVFEVLSSTGSLTGSFLNVSDGGQIVTANGLGEFTVRYGDAEFPNEVVLENYQAVVTPEPGTGATVACALGGFLILLWRCNTGRTGKPLHNNYA